MRQCIKKILIIGITLSFSLHGFAAGSAASELLEKERVEEYFLDPTNFELFENIPLHLKPYVIHRLDILRMSKKTAEIGQLVGFFSIEPFVEKIIIPTKLSEKLVAYPPKLKLDFSIKYKGVKQTKEERPSLHLNYLAREGEIAEGFEASENLRSYFRFNDYFKVVSYIGLFEKWVDEKTEYNEAHHLHLGSLELQYDTNVTGTVKYALGCKWDVPLKKDKKIEIDFLMQQKANHQWQYRERTFSNRLFSGFLFDHWVFTIGLSF